MAKERVFTNHTNLFPTRKRNTSFINEHSNIIIVFLISERTIIAIWYSSKFNQVGNKNNDEIKLIPLISSFDVTAEILNSE